MKCKFHNRIKMQINCILHGHENCFSPFKKKCLFFVNYQRVTYETLTSRMFRYGVFLAFLKINAGKRTGRRERGATGKETGSKKTEVKEKVK